MTVFNTNRFFCLQVVTPGSILQMSKNKVVARHQFYPEMRNKTIEMQSVIYSKTYYHCDYGLIMNPVKPVWPPVIRPGSPAVPVALTESPADSTAVALQEAKSALLVETHASHRTS